MDKRLLFLSLLLIIAAGVYLRALPIANGQFNEPDNYYYASILQQAHGFSLPTISIYNGLPPAEMYGLYVPALLFMSLGLSVTDAMYASTAMATVLILILSYLFADVVFKDKRIALFTMLILALSPALMSRTMLTEYRGDTFSAIFTLIALIALIKWTEGMQNKNKGRAMLYLGLMVISLVIAYYSWTGGAVSIGIILISIFGIIALMAMRKNDRFMAAIAIILILALMGMLVIESTARLPSVGTIAELNPPNFPYLIADYGIILFITPAIALIIPTIYFMAPTIPLIAAGMAAFIACMILKKKMTPAIVCLIAYLIVTVYLNATYIRYAALASIPIAIFAGYGIVWALDQANAWELITQVPVKYAVYFLLMVVFLLMAIVALNNMATLQPSNNDNASMAATMLYLKSYTPGNATILAFWPDGSVIEGMANRQAVTDSVAGYLHAYTEAEWELSDNLSLIAWPNATYVLSRGFYNNEMLGMCNTANNPSELNCTAALYANGTVRSNYTGQLNKTNVYLLINNCNAIPCSISENGTMLKLVYINSTNKVFEVIK